MKAIDVRAVKLLNSRGDFSVAVRVKTDDGVEAWGQAPAGASKGKFEARDYIDGVDKSILFFNKFANKFLRYFEFNSFDDLKEVESKIPAEKFGASATIALEYALLNALAATRKEKLWETLNPNAKKLPRILANVVGGGAHSVRGLDIQEILISPQTNSVAEAVQACTWVYNNLKKVIAAHDKNFLGAKTDEGAWATGLQDWSALHLVDKIRSKYIATKIDLGIDLAATQIMKGGKYFWRNFSDKQKGLHLDEKKQIEVVQELIDHFDLSYVEDPLHQEAFNGFAKLLENAKRYKHRLICGDDLTVTNLDRLKTAIKHKAINAIIIKPNQIGSLIKAKQAFDFALKNNIVPVVSHRSSEPADGTLAHIAFAWQAPFVKFGLAGGERAVKLNELMKIEQNL